MRNQRVRVTLKQTLTFSTFFLLEYTSPKTIYFHRKPYKLSLSNLCMQQSNKNPFNALLGKMIVTKEGKRLGFVKDITFETRSGELINLVVKDSTPYTKNLNLERTSSNELLIPYSAIIAIGDFVIVSEEDLI